MRKKHKNRILMIGIIFTMALSPMQGSALEWFGEDNTVGAAGFHWTFVSGTGESNFALGTEIATGDTMGFAQSLYYKHNWALIDGVGGAYFPTLDLTTYPDYAGLCVRSGDYWETNYLNPAYDLDDDNGDGCYEEAEVTHTRVESFWHKVKTDKAYYFYNAFSPTSVAGTYSGEIRFNHQVSAWAIEWQTLGWDLIDKDSFSFRVDPLYPPNIPRAPLSTNPGEQIQTTDPTGGNGQQNHMRFSNGLPMVLDLTYGKVSRDTILASQDLMDDRHFQNAMRNSAPGSKIQIFDGLKDIIDIESEVQTAQKYSAKLAKKMNLDSVYSIITFDQALSTEEINRLAKKNNLLIQQFEGYGLDANGDKSFIGGIPQDPTQLSADIDDASTHITDFKGVYAIWAHVPVNKLNALENNQFVHTVDLRGFYNHVLKWLYNGVSQINAMDYEINDLFWNYH